MGMRIWDQNWGPGWGLGIEGWDWGRDWELG